MISEIILKEIAIIDSIKVDLGHEIHRLLLVNEEFDGY